MWVIRNIKTKKYARARGMSSDINKASVYSKYKHVVLDTGKDEKVCKIRISLWEDK